MSDFDGDDDVLNEAEALAQAMTPDDGLEALLAEHDVIYPKYEAVCSTCGVVDDPTPYAHQAAVVRAAGWRRTTPRRVYVIEVDYGDTLMTFTTEDEDSADHAQDLFEGSGADVTIIGEEA